MNRAVIPITRPWLGPEEGRAAAAVIESGWLAQGAKVSEFEQALCKITGAEYGVAVSSCTTGLHLALLIHGVGPGDEVITTAFSFQATANMVLATGARPVFADVGEDGNIDAGKIEAAIAPRTKAILPVHVFGNPCDVPSLERVARSHGLRVIYDAAPYAAYMASMPKH